MASRPPFLTAPSARAAPPGAAFTARSTPRHAVSLRTWPGHSGDCRSRTCAAPAAETRANAARPRGGYHLGAQVPGQLDDQRSGDTACAIDQQGSAGPGAERVAERLIDGESGDRHGRGNVKGHRIRDRCHVRGSGDKPLGPCALGAAAANGSSTGRRPRGRPPRRRSRRQRRRLQHRAPGANAARGPSHRYGRCHPSSPRRSSARPAAPHRGAAHRARQLKGLNRGRVLTYSLSSAAARR